MNTPIAPIIFNRPKTTERVFAQIAKAKPTKLFIIADGPRANRPEDIAKCRTARDIVEHVDWECELFKNYSDVDLAWIPHALFSKGIVINIHTFKIICMSTHTKN